MFFWSFWLLLTTVSGVQPQHNTACWTVRSRYRAGRSVFRPSPMAMSQTRHWPDFNFARLSRQISRRCLLFWSVSSWEIHRAHNFFSFDSSWIILLTLLYDIPVWKTMYRMLTCGFSSIHSRARSIFRSVVSVTGRPHLGSSSSEALPSLKRRINSATVG